MRFQRMEQVGLAGKRVFIRADLNVPQDDAGRITDDTRIRASLAAIRLALGAGAAVMVCSHLGRPKEGAFDERESLGPVARHLSGLLGFEVPLRRDWINGVPVEKGKAVLLENCRFNIGEKADDPSLARKMAALCDVYVNDAFGAAHRAEATTHALAKFAKVACAGPLMAAELDALSRAIAEPKRPMIAIVAGAKVSTKLTLLARLAKLVDRLIVGGGILNTFLLARNFPVGSSLAERTLIEESKRILAATDVPLPEDVVVAVEKSVRARATVKAPRDIAHDEMILDIGPRTAESFARILKEAGTILWNGPLGVFEIEQFSRGTETVARAIADSKAYSLAGGGDTLAAIAKYGLEKRISYMSTGGGAFLEFLEGKTLPAVAALEARANG